MRDKTAGYNRHIFRPPILIKIHFKRLKLFFSLKILFILLSNFSTLEGFFSIFCRKSLTIQVRRTFFGNNINWYAFYSKLVTFNSFEKKFFFQNKLIFLVEKTPKFERFEKFYDFIRILRQICYNFIKKVFTVRKCSIKWNRTWDIINWQTPNKKRRI